MRFVLSLVLLLLAPLAPVTAAAQSTPRGSSSQKWVVAWVGSIQGPYPIGNPSTVGGAGDNLHPNRLGYVAMGMAIDLDLVAPAPAKAAKR